jgi:hypothetical protein
MKLKEKHKILLILGGILMFVSMANAAHAAFEYKLLESFPGFYSAGSVMTDFPALILAIYKFGIWTVGIAGLFMLVIGGVMYMTSAGNTATAGSAKTIIWDSLLGIVAALGAYLIMYVINPDLTKINIGFSAAEVTETEGTPMGTAGVCSALSSGDCSVANLTSAFGAAATQASSICNGESRGKNIPSTVDKCTGNGTNDPVSVGLFQINLSAHKMAGLNCIDAFNTVYTAKIAKDRTQCWVKNRPLYDQCVAAAEIPANNIAAAKALYGANSSWKQWGANKNSGCNYP